MPRRLLVPGAVLRDSPGAASLAELRYVSREEPGIRRLRRGKSFVYSLPNGARIADADEIARIRKLAIPPAWTDVWICRDPSGHLQATGRDVRGRLQYRYHPRWREVRDAAKYHVVLAFAQHLPWLRARIERDLAAPRLS